MSHLSYQWFECFLWCFARADHLLNVGVLGNKFVFGESYGNCLKVEVPSQNYLCLWKSSFCCQLVFCNYWLTGDWFVFVTWSGSYLDCEWNCGFYWSAFLVPGRSTANPLCYRCKPLCIHGGQQGCPWLIPVQLQKVRHLPNIPILGSLFVLMNVMCLDPNLCISTACSLNCKLLPITFPIEKGHGAPPNVRQSLMIASLSSCSCVVVCRAVLKWSVPHW